MKYTILYHAHGDDLAEEVKEFLDNGWHLQGNLVSHNGFLHQAMWKD